MSLQDVVDRTARRVDLVVDTHLERARRDAARMRADDAAEAEEERAQRRKDVSRCREHQSRFDEVFSGHGVKAPPPRADAFPPDYRRELFKRGQELLPSDHPLIRFDPNDIDGGAIIPLEKQLMSALREQAETPSGDNIPGPGEPLREVTKTDSATGLRKTTFYGAESFIKGLNRSGRRVVRICDPVGGRVLFGPAFPEARR
jgi:hypothetical protein